MTRLLALSGSLRRDSLNTRLAHALASLAPEGTEVEVRTLHGVPLYDGDLEAEHGLPDAVRALRRAMFAADGVLLVSPEYNNSLPGVAKNAIDWLSRPDREDRQSPFQDRAFALAGASPGAFGTILGQSAWLPVLRLLGARIWTGGRLLLPQAGAAFDAEGRLGEAELRQRAAEFVAGFSRFSRS